MSKLQDKIDALNNVAAAVQSVEAMFAGPRPADAPPVTGAQKMQAAIALVSLLSPQAATVLGPLETIIQGVYNLLKLFGILQRKPVAPADAQEVATGA